MTSKELTEWKAFYELEPFGRTAEDMRGGILASLLANIHRDPKKRSKPYLAMDFMPDYDGSRKPAPKKQSVEQMREALKAIHQGSKKSKKPRRVRVAKKRGKK